MKMKKLFFGLGALATAIAPVAVASQCGGASAAPAANTKTTKADGTSTTPNVQTTPTGQQPITLDLSADRAKLLRDLSAIARQDVTDPSLFDLNSLATDDQRQKFRDRAAAAEKEITTKVIAFVKANGGKELKIVAPGWGTFIHTFTGSETPEQIFAVLNQQTQNPQQP